MRANVRAIHGIGDFVPGWFSVPKTPVISRFPKLQSAQNAPACRGSDADRSADAVRVALTMEWGRSISRSRAMGFLNRS